MLTANELRIGNWVKLGEAWVGVMPNDIFFAWKCEQENKMHEYKPILLTPEILEKCGFEKNNRNEYRLLVAAFTNLFLANPGENDLYDVALELIDADGGFMYMPTEIQYLHQLQNLYFALTGTELTINL